MKTEQFFTELLLRQNRNKERQHIHSWYKMKAMVREKFTALSFYMKKKQRSSISHLIAQV